MNIRSYDIWGGVIMKLINILSFTLFVIFSMAYISKLIILYRKYNISANVLARGKKGGRIQIAETAVVISSFIWITVWLLQTLFDKAMGKIFKRLFIGIFINYMGLIFIISGILFFVTAMINMKTSWRVGIDKKIKTKLVTYGIYKYSRNPAFVGIYLMLSGLFFVYPNLLTLTVLIMNVLSINNLVIQEERHLEDMFQDEYYEYKKKTPRYLFL